MDIVSLKRLTLTKALEEYPEVRKLVVEKNSSMSSKIKNNQNIHNKISTELLFFNLKLVGWSWVYRIKTGQYVFEVFILKRFRRKGFGKLLYNNSKIFLKKKKQAIYVYNWDYNSYHFYNKLNIKNDNKKIYYN